MIVLSVDPHTAYKRFADEMTHYYFQNENGVVHINLEARLINHLPREHLIAFAVDVDEVSIEEYLEAATEVLLHLGFPMANVNPTGPVRRN